MRIWGEFEDPTGSKGFNHTLVIDLLEKICIRMNTIWNKELESYEQDDHDHELKKVNVTISQFDIAEFGFTNGFAINHFGYDSIRDYEFLKRKQKKHQISEIDMAVPLIRMAPFGDLDSLKAYILQGKNLAQIYRTKLNRGTMAHIFVGWFCTIDSTLISNLETMIAIANRRLKKLK